MAESAVFILLDKIAKFLEEEVQLVGGVREEVKYIRDEFQRMTGLLNFADLTEESDSELKTWVKEVGDVALDTADVIDKFLLRKAHHPHGNRLFLKFYKEMKAKHRITSEIQSVRSRVKVIAEGHDKYHLKFNNNNISEISQKGLSSSTVVVNNSTWYDPRGDEPVGIEEQQQQLIEWLVEEEEG